MTSLPQFDVFLCHNSKDKPEVKQIGEQLIKQSIKPWLDEWEFRPGFPWQRTLETQIENIKAAAVFVGSSGLGPWQELEIDAFLREFVKRECPVIPVLLPTAPDKPKLPVFLSGHMWVDFRQPQPEPMTQLIWGITGQKPQISTNPEKSTKTFRFEVVTVNQTGAIIKRENRSAEYFTENLDNNVTLDIVSIPGGTFLMGAPDDEQFSNEHYSTDYERPRHEVTVQPFFMGKYPITQPQWRAVAALPKINRDLNPEPSRFNGHNLPVERVSWYDAVEFCERLSKFSGRNYRLPSEAEWEYASRAGTTTPFYFGETITTKIANFDGESQYADAPKGEYREKTTSVGIFSPNTFGLYDTHGNVCEWCADDSHENYSGAPNDGSVWLNDNTSLKLLRGGSWCYIPHYCRSAFRGRDTPDDDKSNIGFRVVYSGAARTR
jgi:formylglycine-generating enzyme required for sulfatase activity